jgi:TrmH family RNA methyltransferase
MNKIDIVENDKIFNILSPKENCFVIGVFNKYRGNINYQKSNIVLVNPSNAGNLGTIIRTCKGFNIKDIITIGNSVDIFDPKVIRSSMGAIFSININCFDTFEQYRKNYCKHNIYSFYLGTENYLENTSFTLPFSLIFGNESIGLPDDYKRYGKSVTINHSSKIDSLNISIAVGIALYEVSKRTSS